MRWSVVSEAGFPVRLPCKHTADICCWGKSIGNGFSFCAMTGKAEIFDIGGIKKVFDKEGNEYPRVFLTSTTHGGETHALAAGLAVINEFKTKDVIGHNHKLIAMVAEGMRSITKKLGMEDLILTHANNWYSVNIFNDKTGKYNPALRTLFLQEMIARGVLFQGVGLFCFSHTEEDMKYFLRAWEASAIVYKKAVEEGVEKYLVGPAAQPVFRKWN